MATGEERHGQLSLIYALDSLGYAFRKLNGVTQSDFLIALSAWTANVRHLNADAAMLYHLSFENLLTPPELIRPVSRNAISRFLNLPFETTRRRIAQLVELEILAESAEGLVGVDFVRLFRRDMEAVEKNNAKELFLLHSRLAAGGVEMPRAAWAPFIGGAAAKDTAQSWMRAITRVSLDYVMLMLSDMLRAAEVSITDLLILLLITRKSVEHLVDPSIAQLCPGVPRKDIAHSLCLPRETVRRRVKHLVKTGMLRDSGEGFVVQPAFMARIGDANLVRHNNRAIVRMFAKLDELHRHQSTMPRRRIMLDA